MTRYLSITLCVAALFSSPLAQASILLGGTRLVYHAERSEATIAATNEGEQPELIQVWIDDGDMNARPEQLDVPFTISPVMVRIEAGQGQSLRVRADAARLPTDRESVYYLNVLAVPRKSQQEAADESVLQLAMRSRIKLFYRPAKLPGAAMDSAAAVTWRLRIDAQGKPLLVGNNRTPFNVSYSKVSLSDGHQEYSQGLAASGGGGMIPAFGSFEFPLGGLDHTPSGVLSVKALWINDFGGKVEQISPLSP